MKNLYEIFINSEGVSIDSRTISKGQIYFAIEGDRFDGHDYVDEAIAKGASIAVIHNEAFNKDSKTHKVNDTLISLQELALYHRLQFDIPVIGITGSNGKTTTKELIHNVLIKKYEVHTTKGNYNNHIGVPLTLLSASLHSDIMIIEMGANHLKEIDQLCHIARPNYGMITNVGLAHIEGFGSVENIMKAKTELYDYIATIGGHIFYNENDNALVEQLPDNTMNIAYNISELEYLEQQQYLSFVDKEGKNTYSTQLFGKYNQVNIEAAIRIGRYFGVSNEKIYGAIEEYKPSMNRSQIETIKNVTFIKDAYNANPSSMKLSIESMMHYTSDKKCLILGDMKELGVDAIPLHQEILNYLSTYDWDKVILVGPIFVEANQGYNFDVYNTVESLKNEMPILMEKWQGYTVLLKGSRSMRLESLLIES